MTDIPNTLNYMIAGFAVLFAGTCGYLFYLFTQAKEARKKLNEIQKESNHP